MLTTLLIRDFVLIERLELSAQSGLTALTGETGAGKSILLDALGMACGARAEARFVRQGCERSEVSASFAVPRTHPAYDLLQQAEITTTDDELILRRVLQADGRSKAFINDTPVSVSLLRDIGNQLVEVHGQFETTGLLDPRSHLKALDRFAGVDLALLRQRHDELKAAQAELTTLQAQLASRQALEEELHWKLGELKKLGAKEGEAEQLEEKQKTLKHQEKLSAAISTALTSLQGEQGAALALETGSRALARLLDVGGEKMAKALGYFDAARDAVAEAEGLLEHLHSDIGGDGLSLEMVEDRLHDLRALSRRLGVTIDQLPTLRDEVQNQLDTLSHGEAGLAKLEQQVEAKRSAYLTEAEAIHAKRSSSARKLEKAIMAELAPLKMDKAVFTVEINRLSEPSTTGMDAVRFLAATNQGSSAGPLDRIASGGELARFMLALKAALAERDGTQTLIFDEVDQGVGGAVAAAVGERLARLAKGNGQVLVVTHSPQVAAAAQTHWHISKSVKAGTTRTSVSVLDLAARREEIARMLSGSSITESARQAASDLLDNKALA
jgi:DNA repair protein RecN (Recombination protein N)